ncbi:hypothetical protein L6452_33752 [Arctium lappa]|uniref:Uncharacterized protein n=1 Tax=Arctium lappa TaxID=4217 RepID=A0ACB8YH97_ARCLA|nr:hypothetical protein L6452_33752 [Arctium lappa]
MRERGEKRERRGECERSSDTGHMDSIDEKGFQSKDNLGSTSVKKKVDGAETVAVGSKAHGTFGKHIRADGLGSKMEGVKVHAWTEKAFGITIAGMKIPEDVRCHIDEAAGSSNSVQENTNGKNSDPVALFDEGIAETEFGDHGGTQQACSQCPTPLENVAMNGFGGGDSLAIKLPPTFNKGTPSPSQMDPGKFSAQLNPPDHNGPVSGPNQNLGPFPSGLGPNLKPESVKILGSTPPQSNMVDFHQHQTTHNHCVHVDNKSRQDHLLGDTIPNNQTVGMESGKKDDLPSKNLGKSEEKGLRRIGQMQGKLSMKMIKDLARRKGSRNPHILSNPSIKMAQNSKSIHKEKGVAGKRSKYGRSGSSSISGSSENSRFIQEIGSQAGFIWPKEPKDVNCGADQVKATA